MGAGVGILKDGNLTVVVVVLVEGGLTVGQGFVHLVAGIDDGLHILLLQVFLRQLLDFQVALQLATCKDGLRELTDGTEQQLAGVDDHATR